MKYQQVPQLSRRQVESALLSDRSESISEAILSAALYDKDWQWVQNQCLAQLAAQECDVQAAAVLGLAHLARVHQRLDLERVLPALEAAKQETHLRSRIEDALDDIKMFVRRQ